MNVLLFPVTSFSCFDSYLAFVLGMGDNAFPRRLAEVARASKAAEEDTLRRKDLEMEVERLSRELQQVWEILRSRVIMHY